MPSVREMSPRRLHTLLTPTAHAARCLAAVAGSIAVTALFGTLRYSKGLNFPGVQQLHVLFKQVRWSPAGRRFASQSAMRAQLALTLGEVALALAFMGYLVHDSLLVSGLVVGVGMALSALQRMLEANAEEEPQWLKVPVLLALVSSVLYGLIKGNVRAPPPPSRGALQLTRGALARLRSAR